MTTAKRPVAARSTATATQQPAGPTAGRLERATWYGLLVITCVMPFHAFLSVWLGSLTGHQAVIQAWKEVLTLALAACAAALAWRRPALRKRLRQPVACWAAAFIATGLIVTAMCRPALAGIAYGLKTDFEFLVVLAVALLVGSGDRTRRAGRIVIITGIITAAFGLVHALLLPADVLARFGYGVATIVPYQRVDAALDVIRTPSTLGGPNQFGAWLIVPLGLVVARLMRRPRAWHAAAIVLFAGGIWVSYSRAAALGAVATVVVAVLVSLKRRQALVAGGLMMVFGAAAAGALAWATISGSPLQYYVLHSAANRTDTNHSTAQHAIALSDGLDAVVRHPFGSGLGTAGPASLRTADGFIPENFYLQVAVETGLIGLVAFGGVIVAAGAALLRRRFDPVAAGLLAALVGVSVVNLFLHGWADSTLALVFWTLAGLSIGGLERA